MRSRAREVWTCPPIYNTDYIMPPSYSIWSTTTIIVVGNLNIVRGTTITNMDSFNFLESTVTGQSLSNACKFIFLVLNLLALIYDKHQLSWYLLIPR